MTPRSHPLFAVIPAAGLGTRLHPLTLHTPKELLPVGGAPAILSPLLEAEAAGVEEVAVVLSPAKEALRRWLDARRDRFDFELHFVEQREPLGVIDALGAGLKKLGVTTQSYAVLYPDYISLPRQEGLMQLCLHRPDPASTAMALKSVTQERSLRSGRTAFALTRQIDGPLHRILRLEARDAEPGAIHTTFAEIRGRIHTEATAQILGDAAPHDGINLEVFNEVARREALYGVMIDGPVLDLGVMKGYRDAKARFESGQARWRDQGDPDV